MSGVQVQLISQSVIRVGNFNVYVEKCSRKALLKVFFIILNYFENIASTKVKLMKVGPQLEMLQKINDLGMDPITSEHIVETEHLREHVLIFMTNWYNASKQERFMGLDEKLVEVFGNTTTTDTEVKATYKVDKREADQVAVVKEGGLKICKADPNCDMPSRAGNAFRQNIIARLSALKTALAGQNSSTDPSKNCDDPSIPVSDPNCKAVVDAEVAVCKSNTSDPTEQTQCDTEVTAAKAISS